MYSLTLALVFRDENLSQLDSTKQTNKTALNFNDIKRWAQGWSLGWIHDNSAPFLLNSSFFIFAGKCLKRFPIIRISFHTSTESSFRGIKNESTAQVMDECSFRTIHLFRWFLCYVCVLSLNIGVNREVFLTIVIWRVTSPWWHGQGFFTDW